MSTTLSSRRGPGLMGQFQTLPVKPLLRFLTVPYICAQRILHRAREVEAFHMQSMHIARQALHLVILLNDSINAEEGPDEEQQDERVDIGDDLLELEIAMEQWGAPASDQDECNSRIPAIQRQYTQFFKQRSYFHNARDPMDNQLFQRLLAHDKNTMAFERSQQHPTNRNGLEFQTMMDSDARLPAAEGAQVAASDAPHPMASVDRDRYDHRGNSGISSLSYEATRYGLHVDIAPLYSSLASQPTLGPPLPRCSTHPTRDGNNDQWVAGTFLHLLPEDANLRRMLLRDFIRGNGWLLEMQVPSEVLDYFMVSNGRQIICSFCNEAYRNHSRALECVKDHLDYHPR